MNICLFYDDTFKALQKTDAANEALRIFYEAQTFFKEFPTEIHLNLQHGLKYLSGQWRSDEETLTKLLNEKDTFKRNDCHAHVFLCNDRSNTDGTTGKAPIGTVCNDTSERIAIVKYIDDWVRTGRNMAHELGHTLGLHHDFLYPKKQATGKIFKHNRRSFHGPKCTDVGGVMDYVTTSKYSWTPCTTEDFKIYYHQVMKKRNHTFCLESTKPKKPEIKSSNTNEVELNCASNCTNVLAVIWYYSHNNEEKTILEYRPVKKRDKTNYFFPKTWRAISSQNEKRTYYYKLKCV